MSARNRPAPARIIGTVRRDRGALLRSTALQAAALAVVALPGLALSAAAQPAPNARPQGGVVVGGVASISQGANTTTINQATQRAAIDWRSFDIGRDQSVQFQQPGPSAIALNRVVGPNPSAIAGRITANGQIVITNQSGVVFFPGAQVDAQSVVVSAAGITNTNFMNGRMAFDQRPNPNAQIVNGGTITVREAGLAALVAPQVRNSGVIRARMGRAVLAGAETSTLDMYGDGLLSVDVTGQVRQAPRGADGKPAAALVTNEGAIIADGGTVLLTAKAADGVVQNLVQAGGRVRANSVGNRTGRIEIAGTGGSVVVEGRIGARGRDPGTSGGEIVVNASNTVTLAAGARVSASSDSGGGTVAIGTSLARARAQGRTADVFPVGTARNVIVAPGARVAANARGSGNGGTVALLASGTTSMAGSVSARGGKAGGDGGNVEVSGGTLGITGQVDTTAPRGRLGNILLDPYDLVISAAGAPVITPVGGPINVAFGTPPATGVSYVTPASLDGLGGNVRVQTVHDLSVASNLTLTGAGRNLTLEAGHSIIVNPGVTVSATGSLTLNAASTLSPTLFPDGGILTGAGSVLSAGPTGMILRAGAGGVTLNGAVSTAGDLGIGTSGAIQQSPVTGAITAASLFGVGTSISLTSRANIIGQLGTTNNSLQATTGGVTVVDSGDLLVSDARIGGVIVPNGQTISLTTDNLTISTSGGLPRIQAPGGTFAVAPFTAGTPMELVASTGKPPNTLSISAAELGAVQTATLQFGSLTAGNIAVARAQPAATSIDISNPSGITRLVLLSAGDISQPPPPGPPGSPPPVSGGIAVTQLTGQAANFSFTGNNFIADLNGFTAPGNLAFHSTNALTVSAPLQGGTTFLSSTVSINLAANVVGTTSVQLDTTVGPDLSRAGPITQTAGVATTPLLFGAAGSVALNQANQIDRIGDFAAYNTFQLTNARALAVGGALTTTTAAVTLTNPGFAITQDPASTISTPGLNGSAASAAFNSATNQVGAVLDFAVSAGDFSIRNSIDLQVGGIRGLPSPGIIAPAGRTISLIATGLTLLAPVRTGPAAAPSGTVEIAPLAARTLTELITGPAGFTPGAFALFQSDLNRVATGTLRIGSALGTTTAGPIRIGNFNDTISLAGRATTLDLQSAGAITLGNAAGGAFLVVPTLTGTADSADFTAGGTQIATLGAFSTQNGFTMQNVGNLAVTGPVTDNNLIAIATVGNLGLAGNLGAPQVNLVASVNTPGTGNISQSAGAITAGTLNGGAAGTAAFTSAANAVTTLASFTSAGGFTLVNGQALSQTGALADATGNITLSAVGNLTLGGTINAPAAGPNGVVSLTATGGTLAQTGGSITATTLTGSAGQVALNRATNQIANLGAFASGGNLSLFDGVAVSVTGAVSAGTGGTLRLTAPGVQLQPGGSLAAPGGTVALARLGAGAFNLTSFVPAGTVAAITANTLQVGTLTGGPIALTGAFNLANVPTLSLLSAGAITQAAGASITVGTLTGQAASAVLGGAIGTLGAFTTTAGDFSLFNGNLVVAGPVSSPALVRFNTVGTLTVAGNVAAPNVQLFSTNGVTLSGGLITASTGLNFSVSGAVVQTGGGITAGSVFGDAGSLSLDSAANQIASFGAFTANGGITLRTGQSLVVSGGITAGPSDLTLNVAGDLGLNADVTGRTVALNATGAITQTGGRISATTLTGQALSASLPSGNNVLGSLGAFTTQAGFQITTDNNGLVVTGPVTSGASISLNPQGALQIQGDLTAPQITLSTANFFVNGRLTQTAGTITASGTLILNSQSDIAQTGGRIVAGVLIGATGTGSPASFTSATNAVGTLGGFTSTGGFTLVNGQALTQTGTLDASVGNVTLITAGDLDLGGIITAGGNQTVRLTAIGAVTQTGGSITGGTLTGSGNSVALASPTNAIDNLDAFASAGNFTLADSRALNVTGAVSAVTGGALRLTSPAIRLQTGGSLSAPGGTVALAPLPGQGFSLQSFVPAGTVAGIIAATLQVGTPASGAIDINGNFNLASVPNLSLQSGGAVTQSGGGIITVGQLTGQAASLSFLNTNSIGALGAFTASTGAFSLTNGPLVVFGPVSSPVSARFSTIGALNVAGNVTAPNVLLFSTNGVALSGGTITASTGVNFSVTGAVVQTGGGITTNSVFGDAGSLSLDSAANRIATFGGFTAAGGITLRTGQGLTVTGDVNASPGDATLNVTGDLTISALLAARTLALNATGAIGLGAGTSGRISATTLTGSADSVQLNANGIALDNLGSFTSNNGFSLSKNASPSGVAQLTVLGPVTDGTQVSIAIGGDLVIAGNIAAPLVSLSAGPTDPGFSSRGTITQTGGTISAPGQLTLTTPAGFGGPRGPISQTGGQILAGAVTGFGDSAALNSPTNLIATLGSFDTTSGFALVNGQALVQAGTLSNFAGPGISLTVAGALQLTGTVSTFANTSALNLNATGPITQTGGSISAPTLTGSAASASLLQATNAIDNLGAFASTGDFALFDSRALNVTGAVSVGTGRTLSLTMPSIALQPGGSLTASGGTVALAPLPGQPLALSSFVPAGAATQVSADTLQVGSLAAGPISISGAFSLPNVGTLSLISGGAITETGGGSIAVGRLTGRGASAALNGANQIGVLGAFTTDAGFTMTNVASLAVAGPVTDGASIGLTVTGDLAITGVLNAPLVTLAASGVITESGGGAVVANLLTGSAASASFDSAANQVANLGPFTTTTSFLLRDGQSLAVVGTIDSPAVTMIVAGDLAINAALVGGTVSLNATGAITQGVGGAVFASTLSGSAFSARFDQANAVGALAGFTSSGGFLLNNGSPTNGATLAVTGPVVDGSSISLHSYGTLSIAGDISAPAVSLIADRFPGGRATPPGPGNITQAAGTVGASGQLLLTAADAIAQTGGRITAAVVTGSSGGTTSLASAANAIGTLGNFSSVGGFTLVDGQSLSQTGALNDTASVTITTAGALQLGGTVAAPLVGLNAIGAITQPGGSITAATLTGSAGGAALGQAGNAIAKLGAFTSTADFALADSTAVDVTGAVAVGPGRTLSLTAPGVQLQPGGSLTAPGGTVALAPLPGQAFRLGSFVPAGTVAGVTADTLQVGSLAAGSISIAGAFNLASVAELRLLSGGAITESAGGSITVGSLSGQAASAALNGANGVMQLNGFTTTGGFALNNVADLAVNGAVTDGVGIGLNVTGNLTLASGLRAPTVTLTTSGVIDQRTGAISATMLTGSSGGFARLSALNDVSNLGPFTAGGSFGFANSRALTVAGALSGSGVSVSALGALTIAADVTGQEVTLGAAGALTQTNGRIVANRLSGSGFGISLGQAGNAVGILGSFGSSAGFTLNDSIPVAVDGQVTVGAGAALRLTAPQVMVMRNALLSAPRGAVVLAPVDGGAFMLASAAPTENFQGILADTLQVGSAAAGAVSIAGRFNFPSLGLLSLQSGGAIAEAPGASLAVSTLVGRAASVSLDGPNQVGTLGGFTTTGGFAMTNAADLVVGGMVSSGSTIRLRVTGNLALGSTGAGMLAATDAVALNVSGGVTQPNGGIQTAMLTGSVGSARLDGNNSIATLGDFSAPRTALPAGSNAFIIVDGVASGTVRLNNARDLLVSGVDVMGLALTSPGKVTFTGNMTANTLRIDAGGTVTQTGGTFAVAGLTGSASELAQFGQMGSTGMAARISELGAFTVTGSTLFLANGIPLTISGPINAGNLAISAVGSITLAGGSITTTGLPLSAQSGSSPSGPGSYFLVQSGPTGPGQFRQTGTTTIVGAAGSTPTLRIDLDTQGGSIDFSNLVAPTTNLILSTGAGTAVGTIDVGSLLVLGQAGSSNLFGQVGGQGGFPAARDSNIQPGINQAYLLNGCVIQAATCGNIPNPPGLPDFLITSILAPQTFLQPKLVTLDLLRLGVVVDTSDPDLLLPNISDRDY